MAPSIRLLLLATSIAVCTSVAAQSSSKRALGALARSLEESADRQIAKDTEIEIYRRKAEIDLEYQRKLMELRTPRPQAQTAQQQETDPEVIKLMAKHPQWVRILNSTAFRRWLQTQSSSYQRMCIDTPHGDVMASCIDEFFGPTVAGSLVRP